MQYVFSESPVIPVRIGIHMGEIMFRNNGAFGNGVNIASRIESMGIPGSILVSKTIRDQIINKSSFLLASLGTFQFKNVSEPMEVLHWLTKGW
ncbi:MAG: adenylate/guanylate cyclase domain-containing protein [Chitinophagaceae bacterium]|nr:adenylate/guanylate cyclase domain-containing protein [Chitinophagaceae bacterium]